MDELLAPASRERLLLLEDDDELRRMLVLGATRARGADAVPVLVSDPPALRYPTARNRSACLKELSMFDPFDSFPDLDPGASVLWSERTAPVVPSPSAGPYGDPSPVHDADGSRKSLAVDRGLAVASRARTGDSVELVIEAAARPPARTARVNPISAVAAS
jgi:hypothetical protein